MEPKFRLAFDLATQTFHFEGFMLVPIVLTTVGALLVFKPELMQRLLPKGPQGVARTIFSWFYFLFSAFISCVFIFTSVGERARLHSAIQTGSVQTVEGCLQGFHPMPASGHDEERLRVDGQTFSYSDYVITQAFHQTESHGGPVHADSRVRITSVDGDIVKLEVADHACPAAADIPRT